MVLRAGSKSAVYSLFIRLALVFRKLRRIFSFVVVSVLGLAGIIFVVCFVILNCRYLARSRRCLIIAIFVCRSRTFASPVPALIRNSLGTFTYYRVVPVVSFELAQSYLKFTYLSCRFFLSSHIFRFWFEMAAKQRELTALRDLYLAQQRKTWEVAQEAVENKALHSLFGRRFLHLDSIRENFVQQHNGIITAISAQAQPDYASQKANRREFDEMFFNCEDLHAQFFPVALAAATSSASASAPSHSGVGALPKIPLPHFDGKLANWTAFHGMHKSLVHDRDSISLVEKFQYLVLSLSGEPLTLVTTLPLTADNYLVAYDTLVARYENKRLLAVTYWNEIESAPKVTSESHTALRTLLNIFTENLAALKQMEIDNWDFVLFNTLLHKLDSNTRRNFERDNSTSDKIIPSYEALKKFIEAQCRALEANAVSVKPDPVNKSSRFEIAKPKNFFRP